MLNGFHSMPSVLPYCNLQAAADRPARLVEKLWTERPAANSGRRETGFLKGLPYRWFFR